MARSIPISIDIKASNAEILPTLEKVKGGIRSVGSQASSTFNTRYAMFGLKDIAEGRYRFAAAELVNELTRLKGAMLGVGLAGVGVGVLAFAFLELGNQIQKARDKATEAFRGMNESLQKTNDELELSGVKLDNEFSRLSHKPENRIAEALIEGRIAADDLAESLDKDLEKLKKVMEESRTGLWAKAMGMMGHDKTANDAINLKREIDEITARGMVAARNAGSEFAPNSRERLAAQNRAREATAREADVKYNAYAEKAGARYGENVRAAQPKTMSTVQGKVTVPGEDTKDQQAKDAAFLNEIALMKSEIRLKAEDKDKGDRNKGLQDQKRAADEQLKQDQEDLDALKRDHELIIGEEGGFWAERILNYHNGAGAYRDAFLTISNKLASASQEEGKRRLAEGHRDFQLQEDEFARQLKKIQERAEVQGKDPATAGLNFAQAIIEDPNASEGASKAAHDKLLELTKASDAAITADIKRSLEEQDQAWHESGEKTTQEVLTRAQALRASLAGLSGGFLGADELYIAATAKVIAAQKAIYEEADKIAKIQIESKEQTDIGTNTAKRLALEQQYAQYRAHSQQEELANAKALGELAKADLQIKLVAATIAHEEAMDEANLEKIAKAKLEIDNALRAIDQQRLQLAIEITRIDAEHYKTLKAGLDAFIHDANAQMKEPGDILKDGLNSALDQTSDNLTKMMTGQKTKWADEFKSIGREMLKESIKSELVKGLGALGIKGNPTGKKDDPIYTIDQQGNVAKNGQVLPGMVGVTGPSQGGSGSGSSGPGIFGGSGSNPFIFHMLDQFKSGGFKGLFGGGPSSGMGDSNPFADQLATDFPSDGTDFTALARGGDVDPGSAYWVGDGGDGSGKELFTPKTAGTITPASKVGGGGDTYHIDNRGAELGSENRLRAILQSVHASAVSSAVRANKEQSRRMPRNRQ